MLLTLRAGQKKFIITHVYGMFMWHCSCLSMHSEHCYFRSLFVFFCLFGLKLSNYSQSIFSLPFFRSLQVFPFLALASRKYLFRCSSGERKLLLKKLLKDFLRFLWVVLRRDSCLSIIRCIFRNQLFPIFFLMCLHAVKSIWVNWMLGLDANNGEDEKLGMESLILNCLALVHFYLFLLYLTLHTHSQVSPSGWSEGECKGKAGWFPSAYVEKRQRIPVSNVADEAY